MADAKIVSRPATDKYREEYDRSFGKKSKDGPQYGVVQSYNWRGPKSRSTRQVDGNGMDIPESVDNDSTNPITEDGNDPSSK